MTKRRQQGIPRWLSTGLAVAWFAGLVWVERRQALRHRHVESKLRRDVRNLAIGGFGAIALHVAERPIVSPLAAMVRRRR